MTDKILFVDDDQNILASFRRQLRKEFTVETALSGREGLEKIGKNGPFSVVVSDLRMPGMDGIEFLSQVRKFSPNSVRIMLTGNADLHAAIEAVNEGNIFQFLAKPCPLNKMINALTMGIDQYRLITSERELLEKTLRGSIGILTEILELVNPVAFGRSSRLKRYVRDTALHMKIADVWRLETAAMLSQIGCVILPAQTVKKLYHNEEFTEGEWRLFYQHPFIASSLLDKIPRMTEIAKIVYYQEKHFDGSGIPRDSVSGEGIPLGARILKAVLDFDALEVSGHTDLEALSELKKRNNRYDPNVLNALEFVISTRLTHETRSISVSELEENMILDEDVHTFKGQLLLSKGQEVTWPLIERLTNFSDTVGVREPIRVIVRAVQNQN